MLQLHLLPQNFTPWKTRAINQYLRHRGGKCYDGYEYTQDERVELRGERTYKLEIERGCEREREVRICSRNAKQTIHVYDSK